MCCGRMLKRIFGGHGESILLEPGRQVKVGKFNCTIVEVIAQGSFRFIAVY